MGNGIHYIMKNTIHTAHLVLLVWSYLEGCNELRWGK